MRVLRILLFIFIATIFTETAFAAAFQLYELGTPIIGTAGTGQAAVAEDASTAYFNPAGMALLPSSQFMLGSQLLIPYINFSKSIQRNSIPGDNGGNAGMLTPGMDVYFVYRHSPVTSFGISMTSPYGGLLNYNDGWVGRYIVQNVAFYTINVNPSMSVKISDWFAIGAGVAVEYINLQEAVAIPNRITSLIDGQIKLSLVNFAPGFNLGVMFTPSLHTRIGIAYRSRINHDLHGNATFLRIEQTPDAKTTMIMPHNVVMSFLQDFNRFTFLGELGWANWASMKNTILNVRNFSVVTPLNWRNTYRMGLATQFHVNSCLLFQAGASYDSSPTSSSRRLPDLPMDRQIRIGTGVMYKIIMPVTLGASYEYMNFGHANINNISSEGNLVGSYSRNYANVFQVSLNVEM